MRALLLALVVSSIAGVALGQTSSNSNPSSAPSTVPATTAGQSSTGSTAGQNLTTTTAPAPVTTTPPINPAPNTTPTLLTNTPGRPLARKRSRHAIIGTSNTFQNGINGVVNSNDVANGVTSSTAPPLQISPQPSPQPPRNLTNRPPNRSGSVVAAQPTNSPSG